MIDDLDTKITTAIDAGYSPADIRKHLATDENTEELTTALVNNFKPRIATARASGYSDDEVMSYLQTSGVVPSTPFANNGEALVGYLGDTESTIPEVEPRFPVKVEPVTDFNVSTVDPISMLDANAKLPQIQVDMDPQEMVRAFDTINSSYERMLKGTGISTEWKAEANRMQQQANAVIYTQLEARGVEVLDVDNFGIVTIKDPETGETVELEQDFWPGIWDGLVANKGEISGSLVGAGTGAKAGFAIGGPYGAVGGALLGGIIGAGTGRGADVITAARDLQYNIAVSDLIDKMEDAASADGLVGLGVTSLWKLGAGAVRGVSRAWDSVARGNTEGAFQALKDNTDLNDKQIIEQLKKWQQLTGAKVLSQKAIEISKLSGNEKAEAINILGQTLPGMETSVNAAIEFSKSGGSKLASSIAKRATDVQQAAASMTNERVLSTVIDELDGYQSQVKELYGQVKSIGIEASKETDFRFDFNKIKPLEESLTNKVATIRNYGLRKDFEFDLQRIRGLGGLDAIKTLQKKAKAASKSGLKVTPKFTPEALESVNPHRSFENLLELRQVVQDMKGDSRYAQFINFKAMEKATKTINSEIGRAASSMENGKVWLKQWKTANLEYSKMKNLEVNVLFKGLSNPRISSEKAVKLFANSLSAEKPKTVMQVLSKLTPQTRKNVEGAILKQYLEKNTITLSETQGAINFPKLAVQLDELTFTTPEVRDLKRLVKEFSEVFQNDQALARVTWDSPAGRAKNNIATSIQGKANMALHTLLFKKMQSAFPTAQGRRIALTIKMKDVLDNPRSAKAVSALKAAMPNDPELDTILHRLAIETTKFGDKENFGKATVYRVAKPGNFNKSATTQIGEGVLFYTDKAQAKKVAKATGAKVTTKDLTIKRLAQPRDVQRILGREPTPQDYRNIEVSDALREKGFSGLTVDDKVVLFK